MSTETFTTSGTWHCPAGVTSVQIECWGGGAGAAGSDSNAYAGCGGGGGAYSKKNALSVVPGNDYAYVVGALGAGGQKGNNGSVGGDTYFVDVSTVLAKGGGIGTPGGSGGVGGASASGVGDTKYSGGNGAPGTYGYSGPGGGGGSSAGTGANGNNAGTPAGGSAPTGGGTGANGGETNCSGGSASQVGGAGGGGGDRNWDKTNGGAGYDGKIILTYTAVVTSIKAVATVIQASMNKIAGVILTGTNAVKKVAGVSNTS